MQLSSVVLGFAFRLWQNGPDYKLYQAPGAEAKPQVSLIAANLDHFARVSLTVLDIFLDAIAKAKKLIHESIAQNLKRVSLTKSF